MLVGYMRVSKADGSQTTDLQRDALRAAGVADANQLYEDKASGKIDDRPELMSCLRSLRKGDTLILWELDRLGRDLRHLVNIVHDLTERGIGLKVLSGQEAAIDTTTAPGKLVFGIFAALAEFERELISERTRAGLGSCTGAQRRPSAQDDAGNGSAGDGVDGTAWHPRWLLVQGVGRDLPDCLSARLSDRGTA